MLVYNASHIFYICANGAYIAICDGEGLLKERENWIGLGSYWDFYIVYYFSITILELLTELDSRPA